MTHPPETADLATLAEKHSQPKSPYKMRSYLALFLLTMMAGLAVIFYGHRVRLIHDVDIACIKAAAPSEGRLYLLDEKSQVITSHLLTQQPDKSRKFKLITITDDPDQIYERTPPSPLDYAVILHRLHHQGAENIVINTQLTWDGDLGITATALSNKLAEFTNANISLNLTRGAATHELPEALQQSIIPFSNVSGNVKLLPVVNQVTPPNALSNTGKTRAGFSKIESIPETTDVIPMICVWQDKGIVPSIELLAIMTAHQINPDQVIIHCGKYIQLGHDGPVIPISKFGEISFSSSAHQLKITSTTAAENLITRVDTEKAPTPADTDVYLIHAVGEKTKATNAISAERLAAMVHWSQFSPTPAPGKSIQYQRLPLWADIIIIFDIALAAWFFASLSRGNRHLAFALTALLTFPLLISIMEVTQHWFSISAPLAAIIMAWLTLLPRKKNTHPIEEYSNTNPKPIISE